MLNKIKNIIDNAGISGLLKSIARKTFYSNDKHKKEDGQGACASEKKTASLETPEYTIFQESAHRAVRRYCPIEGKNVLEVGGSSSCISAKAFIRDGAKHVTVTGLDHIAHETQLKDDRISISRVNGLELSKFYEPNSFDVVYGLSIIEHIPDPKRFLAQVRYVLKPGGFAYFEGYPLWSSPKGHHLWVTSWEDGASSNYLFCDLEGIESTNPVPDWGHLTLSEEELATHLRERSIPESDIKHITDWIYNSEAINRLTFDAVADAYTNSGLITLEANIQRVEIPEKTKNLLMQKYAIETDYGVCGISYLLRKG